MEFAYSAAENTNGTTTLENRLAASHPKTTPIMWLGKETKTYVHTKTRVWVNVSCSFTGGYQMTRTGMPFRGRKNKQGTSTWWNDARLLWHTTWMHFRDPALRERSQPQKTTCCYDSISVTSGKSKITGWRTEHSDLRSGVERGLTTKRQHVGTLRLWSCPTVWWWWWPHEPRTVHAIFKNYNYICVYVCIYIHTHISWLWQRLREYILPKLIQHLKLVNFTLCKLYIDQELK